MQTPILPDGSSFFTGSFPLPKDHWLYAPQCAEWDNERDTSADTPRPILDNSHREAVKAALRYAIRGATMNGKGADFDPDALVLNAVYALCGPAKGSVLPCDAPAERPTFKDALAHVINCYSMENGSNTPDFVLAEYLLNCLVAFNQATIARRPWDVPPLVEVPGQSSGAAVKDAA